MNKKLRSIAAGTILAASSTGVHAILSGGETLGFDDGVGSCLLSGTYPDTCLHGLTAVNSGSFFAMDTDGDGQFLQPERIPISSAGTGFTVGVAQVIGAIDQGWGFASNTGFHHTSAGTVPAVNPDGSVNMNGWTVNWSGGDIDMGQGGNATITCGTDCSNGDTFALDYTAVVPTGNFTGVAYQLHLEGTVVVPVGSNPPVAVDDNATVDRGSSGNVLNILVNDTDPENNIDISTIVIQTIAADGTATPNANGTVTYDHNGASLDPDSFTYTVKDTDGNESNAATVTINIQNIGVFADDDTASIDTAINTSVDIDVTQNDIDGEGAGVDPATVVIVQDADPAKGVTTLSNGIITYTPVQGFIGSDTMTYTVENNLGTVSNVATVLILVSNSESAVLDPAAFLLFTTGNVAIPSVRPPLGNGSWFSMEVIANTPTHTPIAGFNYLQLGIIQPASTVPLSPNIDQPWSFFGNTGVHQSTVAVTIATDDGAGNVTLVFAGWDVSWNGIDSIPLGSGQDNGIATLTCFIDLLGGTPGDCSPGDEFSLDYRAIVPPGDVSGFGGVNYALHMEGVISLTGATIGPALPPDTSSIQAMDSDGVALTVQPGQAASSAGNTTGYNLTAADIGSKDPLLNPNDGEQCLGGCIDVVIANVTTDYVDVIFRLNKVLPEGAVYRKLLNGVWKDFDISANDQVGSNADNGSGVCTDPTFSIGLRSGDQCVFLRIFDGGPNDADGVKNGTVVDPSGALLAGSPNVPPSSTSGCSISSTEAGLSDRADWLLVLGFFALLLVLRHRHSKV